MLLKIDKDDLLLIIIALNQQLKREDDELLFLSKFIEDLDLSPDDLVFVHQSAVMRSVRSIKRLICNLCEVK